PRSAQVRKHGATRNQAAYDHSRRHDPHNAPYYCFLGMMGTHAGYGGKDDGRHRGGNGGMHHELPRHAKNRKEHGQEGNEQHAATYSQQPGGKSHHRAQTYQTDNKYWIHETLRRKKG